MQARKLVRLLNEMISKDPSVAYMKVCVDRKYTDPNYMGDMQFKEISDVEEHQCVWEPENFEVEHWRRILVLGNY